MGLLGSEVARRAYREIQGDIGKVRRRRRHRKSPLYLRSISAISPQYLRYISAASPLYLPYSRAEDHKALVRLHVHLIRARARVRVRVSSRYPP